MSFQDLQSILGPGGLGVGGVFAFMWWIERKERLRLQRVLEGYLMPMVEQTQRIMRSVRRVVADGDDDV